VTGTVVRDRGDIHADPAALFVSALADEIADRLATRLGPHLAELVEAGAITSPTDGRPDTSRPSRAAASAETAAAYDDGLWSAGRVAEHYDVAVRFVYQHADELGCVRLGGGVRPRLRFDPKTVSQRWPQVGGSLPETAPARRSPAKRRQTPDRPGRPRFELLDFDREP
jgi:hypothetical protein